MIIGSVLEFFLGNTFPFVVFGSFGAFWLTFAATLTPQYNASIAYDPTHPAQSVENPVFTASFAYFPLYMGLLCFVFLICSLRTNIVFVTIFMLLIPTFTLFATVFWKMAEGTPQALATALTAQHAAGGLAFTVALLGWYLLIVQLLASVDFPLNLPVGDLSRVIRGASEKSKAT
jgi:succinate-acetate transporter protein